MEAKPNDGAKRIEVGKNADDVVKRLEEFPNPNAIWSAFECGLIDETTAISLLPGKVHSIRWNIANVFRHIFIPFLR